MAGIAMEVDDYMGVGIDCEKLESYTIKDLARAPNTEVILFQELFRMLLRQMQR